MCIPVEDGIQMKDGHIVKFTDVDISAEHITEMQVHNVLLSFYSDRRQTKKHNEIIEKLDAYATKEDVDEKIELNNEKRNKNIIWLSSIMVAFVTVVSGILLLTK